MPAEQSESGNLQLDRFSSDELSQFAGGVRSILNVFPQENLQDIYNATHELDRENMTPGEMLITYDIMHNPVMEAIASVHAKDAIAFANDVMINLIQVERLQQNNQSIGNPYDWNDDDDTDPETKARKRDERLQQALTNMSQDAHDERMERERKEWQEKWDKQMHRIGDKEYSGADLHNMYKWLSDTKNANTFEKDLKDKYGLSEKEAKKQTSNLYDYLKLKEKQRNQEPLTKEEQYALDHPSAEVSRNMAELETMKNSSRNNESSSQTNEWEASHQENSTIARANFLAETSPEKETTTPSTFGFKSTSSSEIKTDVALTTTYNKKSSPENKTEEPPQIKPEHQPKVTAAPSGDFAFG